MTPYHQTSPAHPFTGFVLNLNVRTQCHRDLHDHVLCVVLVFGQYSGGELVLYEPGLVLDLKNGDFVVFASDKITHFNLDFEGVRGSLVMHTDKALAKWSRDLNDWRSNTYASHSVTTRLADPV